MHPFFGEEYGNPFSLHGCAAEPKKAVDSARKSVAHAIGARPNEIIFTSGGTESNNTALKGVAFACRQRGDHIITCAIEHDSVLSPCAFLEQQGFAVTVLPVDGHGLVDPDALGRAITAKTVLVSIMHANNEIGTIQPIAEIGKITKRARVALHVDAVQTFGHLPLDVDDLDVDLLSVSGHKAYGPKGVGALYIRRGRSVVPLLHGGAQEDGLRASTHNVPGIVGLGRAAQLAREEATAEEEMLGGLQRRLVDGVLDSVSGTKLNGHPTQRLAGNVSLSFPDAQGDLLLRELDKKGIACSTGSSCRESASEPSHVLSAMGLSDARRAGTLRFSLGRWTTVQDIDYLLEVLPAIGRRARSLSEFLD